MPQVLTTKAIVLCPHLQRGVSTASDPIWSVDGGFVLLEGDMGIFPTCIPPIGIPPCVSYALKSMGLNATKVSGRKVILVTDFNQTLTGLPLLMTETHQTIDDSTPASLPRNESSQGLPPELADTIKPVVTVAPPTGVFSVTFGPPTLPVVFILFSRFPLKWILTRQSEVPPVHVDATNGEPTGLLVLPAGGYWSSPNLSITMTLSALYMAGLGAGRHHFYMTAVNQRGLNSFAKFDLTVTP